jgi:hypothetical protein
MRTFRGIPRTVEEAIEQVLSGWSKEEIESFHGLQVVELFDLRNTLGADIRNTFSLWYGNDELLNDCEHFLTSHKEFYDSALWIKEENEQGKKRVADLEDNEEDEEDDGESFEDFLLPPVEESFKIGKTNPAIPIDPFIASQVIIFAVWNHLQVHGLTL